MTAPPLSPEQATESERLHADAEKREGRPSPAALDPFASTVSASPRAASYGSHSLTSTRNATSPNGRNGRALWITDTVLNSNLTATAKLIPSVIARAGGRVSLSDLEAALPASRSSIHAAIRELEAGGWLTIHRNRPKGQTRSETNYYHLAPHANPRRRLNNGRGDWANFTTTLRPTRSFGRSPSRWILAAVWEREQARNGAIHLPDEIAARLASTSVRAVKLARIDWLDAGLLRTVKRGSKWGPGVYALTRGSAPHEPARFESWRRRARAVTIDGATVIVWATISEEKSVHATMTTAGASTVADFVSEHHGKVADARVLITQLNERWPRVEAQEPEPRELTAEESEAAWWLYEPGTAECERAIAKAQERAAATLEPGWEDEIPF